MRRVEKVWHSPLDSANRPKYLSAQRRGLLCRARPTDRMSVSGGYEMKFRPLHDRVVVRRVEEEERTKGGIIIPDTAKEKPQQGEIVAVGPGARNEEGKIVALDVKEGDRVLFGKWSGTEVKIDGEDLLIMKESDILGVIENHGGAAAESGGKGKKKAAA